mmetsp:Transcript_45494/g.83271  ORF Transcript_45494/g.83271 Transcript_45494/m.83271 type:complete len:795 (+) Transcript_45494:115-2499(+)
MRDDSGSLTLPMLTPSAEHSEARHARRAGSIQVQLRQKPPQRVSKRAKSEGASQPRYAWWRDLFSYPGASPRKPTQSQQRTSSRTSQRRGCRSRVKHRRGSPQPTQRPASTEPSAQEGLPRIAEDRGKLFVRDWADTLRQDPSTPIAADCEGRVIRKDQALRHLLATRQKWREEEARWRDARKQRMSRRSKENIDRASPRELHVEVSVEAVEIASPCSLLSRRSSSASSGSAGKAPPIEPTMSLMSVQRAPASDQSKRRSGAPDNGVTVAHSTMEGTLSAQQGLSRTEQGRVSLASGDGSLVEFMDKEAIGSIREEDPSEKDTQVESRRHAGVLQSAPRCMKGCCICSIPLSWDDWRAYYPMESLNVFATAYNSILPDDRGWRKFAPRHLTRMIHAALGYASRAIEEALHSSGLIPVGSLGVAIETFWELLSVAHRIATHLLEHHVESVLSSHDYDHMRKVFRSLSNSMERLPTSQLFRAVKLVDLQQVNIALVEHQHMVADATASILEHKVFSHHTETFQQGVLTQDEFISILLQVIMVREQQQRRLDLESERQVMAEGGFSQLELEDLRALHTEYTNMQVPDGLGALARLVRMLALCGGSSPSTNELAMLRDIVHAGICSSWSAQESAVAPFHVFARWMHKIFSGEICGLRRGATREASHTGALGFVATVYNETHVDEDEMSEHHEDGSDDSRGNTPPSSPGPVQKTSTEGQLSPSSKIAHTSRGNPGTPTSRSATPPQAVSPLPDRMSPFQHEPSQGSQSLRPNAPSPIQPTAPRSQPPAPHPRRNLKPAA